ncbi:hypothetical protein EV178_006291 [Coemansia sp. RSA 1646]|nr:hypothetical protein EV178_006291 [Coemansia sp. RSA 1646]
MLASLRQQLPRSQIYMPLNHHLPCRFNVAQFHAQTPSLLPFPRKAKAMKQIKDSSKKAGHIIEDTTDTSSRFENLDRMLQRKQFVLDNFDVPSKFQKYFTGRLRKREASRMQRQLEFGKVRNGRKVETSNDVVRVNAREITHDEAQQQRKMLLMRGQILRIIERHLSSASLPAHHLSMQNWEIIDVIVTFNLKEAICFYKVTPNAFTEEFGLDKMRRVIDESTDYFNTVVNRELDKGVGKGIGTRKAIRLKFSNGEKMTKLIDKMASEVDKHESGA